MIIVIGKEDRAMLLDAQAYIRQCADFYKKEKPFLGKPEYTERIVKDCNNIADRILKVLGV